MSKFASSVFLEPNLKILLNRRSSWFSRSPKSVPKNPTALYGSITSADLLPGAVAGRPSADVICACV